MKTGLVSVTFRPKTPEQVVALVAKGKLDAIEWGGDIHVPHGDVERAKQVRRMTLDAGLIVASYGSYYRAAHSENDNLPFAKVLDSALALDAPTIRVWAGTLGSAKADAANRAAVADDLRRIGSMAAGEGITVSLEYHGGTLTDTNESAAQLLQDVNHPNIRLYWQPPEGDEAYRMAGLKAALPVLSNLHVFHWVMCNGQRERCPLAEGHESWKTYFRAVRETGRPHAALLEFVRGDSDEQFLADAATLRDWVAQEHAAGARV